MRRILSAFCVILLVCAAPVLAEDRVTLGFGRLLTNDYFGDGKDRWQTGSGVLSLMRGPEGMNTRPATFATLLEYRFTAALAAPDALTVPAPGDRPYAGTMSLGLHSHFTDGPLEASIGFDLVATGPQTGIGRFQSAFHDLLGIPGASGGVLAGQIPNAIYPTGSIEIARPLSLGTNLTYRPYVAVQAGVENYLRVGGDLLWGGAWDQGIYLRDPVSGQLYQSMSTDLDPGFSVLLGADVAKVFGSALLPVAAGYQLTPLRSRARMGLHWQGENFGVFYGATWLGREFNAQPEGQIVGAMRISVSF